MCCSVFLSCIICTVFWWHLVYKSWFLHLFNYPFLQVFCKFGRKTSPLHRLSTFLSLEHEHNDSNIFFCEAKIPCINALWDPLGWLHVGSWRIVLHLEGAHRLHWKYRHILIPHVLIFFCNSLFFVLCSGSSVPQGNNWCHSWKKYLNWWGINHYSVILDGLQGPFHFILCF